MANLHLKSFLTNNLFFLLVIPAVAVRFLWLDQIPPGINHDEADAIQIARSYFTYGTDSLGTKFPLALIKNQVETGDDTLLSLLLAPAYRFLRPGVAAFRFPMVVINLLTAISLFVLATRLARSKIIGVSLFIVFLYSPWSLVFSSSLTQAPLALLFASLAINLFLVANPVLSAFTLGLTFLSYYGAKPLVLVLGIALPFWSYFSFHQLRLRNALTFWFVLTFLISFYFFFALRIPDSTFSRRRGEVRLFDLSQYSRQVDEFRRMSIDSPMGYIFSNKPVLLIKSMAEKYFNFYSPDFLFFGGDPGANSRFGDHGLAYLADAPLFLLGLAAVFVSPLGLLAAMMLLIGPVGTVINTSGVSDMYRGFLFLPGFLLIVSLGISFLYRRFYIWGLVILFFIYALGIINFWNFYFFRLQVTSSEASFFSERVLSNYLLRTNTPVLVVAGQPLQVLQQLSIFSDILHPGPPAIILKRGPFKLGLIEIINSCPIQMPNYPVVVQSSLSCPDLEGTTHLVIQNQKDTGTLWKIYFDNLCHNGVGDYWRRFHLRSDYRLESLSLSQFCNRWIAKIQ